MHFEDQVTPATILAELVRYAQAHPDETKGFRHLRHNNDLCPRFYDQSERVLTSFDKYTSVTYDIQGPRDRGTDVVIRYSISTVYDGEERYIAMQVKSFDEFEQDDDLVSKIKAQIYESEKDYGDRLDRYYLLLCTEHKKHLNRVRAICAELKADTKVIVIEPRYAWFFFQMNETIIDAVADRLLYPDDFVRRKAKEQVAGIGKKRLILLLSCLVHAIEKEGSYAVTDDFVTNNSHVLEFKKNNPHDHGSLSEDVDAMEGRYMYRDIDVNGFGIYEDSVSAIVAMYYDTKVRYGHEGDAAVKYLYTFLERNA